LFSIILPLSLNKEEKRVSFCGGGLFLLEMRAASFFTADGCCPQNEREKEKQARQKRLFSRAKG
jgi:hypothetical protein